MNKGDEFADLNKEPQLFKWSKNAPKWRTAKIGLCLEGKCTNKQCEAYNNNVIINMGVPIMFKLGMPTANNPTICPICKLKATTCAFNNCDYRYIAIKESYTGLEKINCEWKTVGDNYYLFDDNKKTEYVSLVIETRCTNKYSHFRSITEKLGCKFCLSEYSNEEIKESLLIKDEINETYFHQECKNNWLNNNKHIMISYNMHSRSYCEKLKQELEQMGRKCWMDVSDMHGSTLDSMAKAVEEASCIIICMTKAYKESKNCELEAKYIQQLRKPIVPLLLEKNFKPNGW